MPIGRDNCVPTETKLGSGAMDLTVDEMIMANKLDECR